MLTRVRPLIRDEVRSIDRLAAETYGLPTLLLMENAGRGAADYLRERAGPPPRRVVVLCGNGNNGGDGGVVARFLDAWGYDVSLAWFGDPARRSADAATQFGILARCGFDQAEILGPVDADDLGRRLAAADWIVDGLLGTGPTREVSGPLRDVIAAVNRSARPVVALDLPSGLDADTGEPLGPAIEAAATATFVGPKLGFTRPGAERYAGDVRVIDIGVPRRLLEPYLAT
jgi:NAD(P)H-hydrate epimerase